MSSTLPNILLIGLRGSGKSTLGHLLAEELDRPFVDMDDQTAAALGCDSVAGAWDEHGESGFRRAETSVLRRLLGSSGRVIALGGGTPTAPGADQTLREAQIAGSARIFYLRAGAYTLRQRLLESNLADRPSLTGTGTIDEIELVLARRDGLYLELADEVVNVDGLAEATVLRELAVLLG